MDVDDVRHSIAAFLGQGFDHYIGEPIPTTIDMEGHEGHHGFEMPTSNIDNGRVVCTDCYKGER